MEFKWIYFLVWLLLSVVAVFDFTEAATQLRLVNGLLIIEDHHPLEVSSSSSRSQNFTSGGIRAALREGRNHDLHGHGYLNRAASLRSSSSRRLLKDGQGTTSTTTTSPPPPPSDNSIDDRAVLVLDIIEERETATTGRQQEQTDTDKDSKDMEIDSKMFPKLDHSTTPVNSVTSPTMDVITIIWYFSTFIALVAFFVVMVCSDKYCTRGSKPEETVVSVPSTPAPSYREFAPPSYESVMKKHKSRVFIIPMLNESGELKVPEDNANVGGGGSVTPGDNTQGQQLLQVVEVQKHNNSQPADERQRRDMEEEEKAPAYETAVTMEVNEGQGTDKSGTSASSESR